MAEMPTLGRPRRRPGRGAFVLVLALAVLAVGWWWLHRKRSVKNAPIAVSTDAAPANATANGNTNANASANVDGHGSANANASDGDGGTPPEPPRAKAKAADEALKAAGLRFARADISGSLESALVTLVGRPLGQALTPVAVRSLVWWVKVPDDLRRGDEVDALFEERASAEPVVVALRFKSEKAGRTFRAYRFKAEGDAFARMYLPSGEELERRLKDGPIDDYEQVTSLLHDGRGHKGVDFKTPVGTPVKSPFDGEVVRRNWKGGTNGNSLEIRESGGAHRSAVFLHLSEASAAPGARVRKGQVVAKSGNTGHSFAPHLHYQLMSPGGNILDPFDVHETFRRTLPDAQKPLFETEVRKLDGLIDQALDDRR
ncbi:MAG TPA: M23 family metallopeptidase [Polyangia bacterium]|nr:M23 family metallopeptidase [Polyangia bacterium]